MREVDVVVIGAGLLGLASAYQLLQHSPHLKIVVFDKEPRIAGHQSGHNSGVIHSGIYYKPGSLKAKNCVAGVKRMEAFCAENGIAVERCGKVIVATETEELPRLEELYRRGVANGVPGLEMVEPSRMKELEPNVAGIKGLWSPNTSIVDYIAVAKAYARLIQGYDGRVSLGEGVRQISRFGSCWAVDTDRESYHCKLLLNCAGAQSDRIAAMAGENVSDGQIVPFRGEYYSLVPDRVDLVKSLIYPVPDPRFPFLGVHLSRTIHGTVEAGPNAVLALSREGYRKSDISLRDLWQLARYPGIWKMGMKYWRMGLQETYRSYSKAAFLRSLQRLVPCLEDADLVPGGSGVRAQAVMRDGRLHDDFWLKESPSAIHVLNAPSPGATASLSIGGYLAERVLQRLSGDRQPSGVDA